MSNAYAARNPVAQNHLHDILEVITGDWYNHNGNKVLSIGNGYINGCPILAGFDWAGSKQFGGVILRIKESSGVRDIHINWLKGEGAGNYVQIDKGEHLHNTTKPYFFESVGGIYLGMTAKEIEAKYGQAQKISPGEKFLDGSTNRVRWYYPKQGIVLWFDGDSISHISLLKNSPLHFERSGLNCQNTPQEFAKAYSMSRIPDVSKKNSSDMAYSIGHGENLYFGSNMNYVGLDIYGW